MLTEIRERTQGWIAYVIVGLIVLVMALFGMYSYFSGPPSNEVAEVNGQVITVSELDRVYRQVSQSRPQAQRREVLEQMIGERLIDQYVQDGGYRLGDDLLRQIIFANPAFHDEQGKFSPELYQARVRAVGLTERGYEAQVSVSERVQQLEGGVFATAFVTDPEVERVLDLIRQEREITFLRVPHAVFTETLDPSDEELKAYYEAHPELFQSPERVRLAYVELSPQSLPQPEVSEDELRQYYEQNKNSRFLAAQPARELSHILVGLPEDADAAAVEAAQARLLELRQRIEAGELSFAEGAKQYSEDPYSAEDGGKLGLFRPSDAEGLPAIEAGFELAEGEISQPVRTEEGLHLVQATDVREREVQPYEAVEQQIREELVAERLGDQIFKLADELDTLAFENARSLGPAADKLGIEVQQTDWITREGAAEGFAADPKVIAAAFDEEVLGGYNSKLLELGENRFAVVRVEEHEEAALKPYDAVAEQVRKQWAQERSAELAEAKAQELREALEQGAQPTSLAQGGIELQQPGFVGRDAAEVPAPVREEAFELPKPSADDASYGTLSLPGEVVVVQVSGVRRKEASEDENQQRERLQRNLSAVRGNATVRGLQEALRSEAEVRIYEDRL